MQTYFDLVLYEVELAEKYIFFYKRKNFSDHKFVLIPIWLRENKQIISVILFPDV